MNRLELGSALRLIGGSLNCIRRQRLIWWTLSLDCCNKNRLKPSNLASWNSIDCEWESRTVTVNIRQKAEIAWIGVEELETGE